MTGKKKDGWELTLTAFLSNKHLGKVWGATFKTSKRIYSPCSREKDVKDVEGSQKISSQAPGGLQNTTNHNTAGNPWAENSC